MTQTVDYTIERNSSDAMAILPDFDFTTISWNFYYHAKSLMTDSDVNAVISITPELISVADIKTLYPDAVIPDHTTVHLILINFQPSQTRAVIPGTYHHALRAVDAHNSENVIPIFNGCLTVTHDDTNDQPTEN